MAESIYITSNSRLAKNKSDGVAKKIKDASSDINSAKKELNNVDYVNLSYEINQLETMYKKNNQQASEFEVFASTLEKMVNDYVDTDKNCATRIKSNGRNHRKNTGLAQNLALATICASFDKIGNKISQITDGVKDWVSGVVNWFKTSIKEDWESYLQFIEGGVSLFAGIGTLMAGISAAATGAGIPVAIPMIMASLISMYTGMDKIVSSLFDIGNIYETDGSTITKESFDNRLFSFAYDTIDAIAGIATGVGLGKLSDVTQATEVYTLLGKGDFAIKGLEFIKNINKISGVSDYIDYLKGGVAILSTLKDKNIDNILEYSDDKIRDSILKGELNDFFEEVTEKMIKNKLIGVLG